MAVVTDPSVLSDDNRREDLRVLRQVLDAGRRKKLELITSTFTIAEVRRAHGQEAAASDLETRRLIASIVSSGEFFLLYDVTQQIGERARDLSWEHGLGLRGPDSIHVATALAMNCQELLTRDGENHRGIIRFSTQLEPLGLRVITPRATLLLPAESDEPTQAGLFDVGGE